MLQVAVGAPVRNQQLPQHQGATKSILAVLWKQAIGAAITYAVVMTLAGSAFLYAMYHEYAVGFARLAWPYIS
ncbi:hypothetical protein JVT61DRAFT_4802 [Boletus reticuloceps]|uniref:Uncharacterized protein n=1 Tax=Boletus reticuloceps TaxID=495285 RepID=A0A8I2YKB7_9AGAM|nr:hypothetical protein JVT61DRAFT_4802 [Boletus reticuloceps]